MRRVFEEDAWADRALHGEAQRLGLDPRDRALAMRLAYGTVQRRATLDHVDRGARRPRRRRGSSRSCCAALRLGLYQLAFLDRVPAHAAVGESVALVKRAVAAAARSSSTPCCGAPRARRRDLVAALPDAHAARGRAAPLPPGVDRRAVVGRARRRTPRAR